MTKNSKKKKMIHFALHGGVHCGVSEPVEKTTNPEEVTCKKCLFQLISWKKWLP